MFSESQYFRQKWLWALLALTGVISIYYPISSQNFSGALIFLGLYCGFLTAFYFFRLESRADDKGIFYRLWPLHLKERRIDYSQIEDVESGSYSPLKEFGGWGLRWRPGKIAFSVSGKKCIRLKRSQGREIVIGTQRPEEFSEEVEKHL